MPLTRPTADHLARLIHELRPQWDLPGILHALKRYAHDPRPPEHIAVAFIRAAADTGPDGARTPLAVHARPSYWNPDQPLDTHRPRLTPEHECPRHPGQWAATCTLCAADKLAGDHTPTPYDPTDPSGALRRQAIREARAAAAHARAQWAAQHPEPESPVTVTRDPMEDTREDTTR